MFKEQRMQRLLLWTKTLCFLAAISLACLRCPAQIASAELSGNVLDFSGAAVPNATVTATNIETSIAHTVPTGKSGDYVITSLPRVTTP